MLHHLQAVRNSSLSRNGFLTWRKHALAHHDGTIRSNSQPPAVLRCSLFLLLLLLHKDRKGGKNKKRGGARWIPAKGSGKGQSSKDFDYLMKLPLEFRAKFHEKFHKNEICYNFQKNACKRSDGKCKFSHVCVGCGGSKPYDECKCLTSKIH